MLNLLTTPVLYTIISLLATGGVGMIVKSCSDASDYRHLQAQYTKALEDLRRCQEQQAVVQHNLQQQADQLKRYTASQDRYRLNSIMKYEAQHEKTQQQDCTFDFTFVNELLKAQGTKRL